jgi:RNA-directed DNA polymerase
VSWSPAPSFMAATEFVVDFRRARTLEDLAVHVGAPLTVLRDVVEAPDQQVFYTRHDIPKRVRGEYRRVWEARSDDLGDAHRSLARRLDAFARDLSIGYPQSSATAYVRGASILKNAFPHAQARLLLRTDISNFFESIPSARVERLLLGLRLQGDVARALARFTTINGVLPLGIHTSPLLANLICMDLDEKLLQLAVGSGCAYTRYADDITFSGPDALPSRIEIASVVAAEGFKLSERKFRTSVLGQLHYVTGLSVSDSRPRAPRPLKRRLRQELHYAERFGLSNHLGKLGRQTIQAGINRIDGTIRYLNAIEPTLAQTLRRRWQVLLDREGLSVSYAPRHERDTRGVTMLIDESEIPTEGGTILALGCVTTQDLQRIANVSKELVATHIADPFTSGRKAKLEKRGLHFADSPEELRAAFIKELPTLSYRTYIAYEALADSALYEDTYLRLLRAMLPRRLRDVDRAEVTIVVETNSRVAIGKVQQVVTEVFDDLVSHNDRRPAVTPLVQLGKKESDPAIAVVDFMLSVFRAYAMLDQDLKEPLNEGQRELASRRFEQTRDKLRLIMAFSPNETFSRRRPFRPWRGARSKGPQ